MARRHEEWVIALIGELSHVAQSDLLQHLTLLKRRLDKHLMRLRNASASRRMLALRLKNAKISSRAAIVGWPASSIRCAVTTLCGVVTWRSKNGARSVFAALSGSTRPMKRSPSASHRPRSAAPCRTCRPRSDRPCTVRSSRSSRSRTGLDFVRRDFDAGRIVQRQRRLRSTGASIDGSSIIVSAKFPVKAHPDGADAGTAALAVRKSRQRAEPLVTGLDPFAASARNSALTQAR